MKDPSFEDAQRELEQIVERLERGEANLDEAIQLWERGEELYKLCVGKLDAAQGKVDRLEPVPGDVPFAATGEA